MDSILLTKAQNNLITEHESIVFYLMKGFAILSVIAAHVNEISTATITSEIATTIWAVYARIGVPAFLILAGFFFDGRNNTTKVFWKRKLKTVILPWFICGICTYGLIVYFQRSIDLLSLIKWILGFGTFYYYMTVLILLYLIFRLLPNNIYIYIMRRDKYLINSIS